MRKQKKSIAAFDVDGVLSEDFGGVDCVRFLHENGLFDTNSYKRFMEYVDEFRKGKIDYSALMKGVTKEYQNGLKGKSHRLVKEASERFFEIYKNFIYPYAKPLVMLFGENYAKIIISGSSHEFLEPFRDELGFDDLYASKIKVNNGICLKEMERDMSSPDAKSKAFWDAVSKLNLTVDYSFAFGDTEHDIPLLEKVENPFVLNPSPILETYAEQKSWPIFREKDDILQQVSKRLESLK